MTDPLQQILQTLQQELNHHQIHTNYYPQQPKLANKNFTLTIQNQQITIYTHEKPTWTGPAGPIKINLNHPNSIPHLIQITKHLTQEQQ